MPKPKLTVETVQSLSQVDASEWNALLENNSPFLRYEFLSALEKNHCLGEYSGWHPRHFLLKSEKNKLLAAVPAYLKTNSFGEFVFDWSWASAYQRAGLEYYPKLVIAIPFTPASGRRLLISPEINHAASVKPILLDAIVRYAQMQSLSGIHCLFPSADDQAILNSHGWMERVGYQYHWHNQAYKTFDDFISRFKSRKRKKTKRERSYAQEYGISFSIKHGHELSESEWMDAYRFYQMTFSEKGNFPALTMEFFLEIAQTMGEQIIVIFAQKNQCNLACAIYFKSDKTLYGRYWGSQENIHCLHFETCFYQGIDYCINNSLSQFEPGAQGEHKITRGFLPTQTTSAHWIFDSRFKSAIQDFLYQEQQLMAQYKLDLDKLSPFKHS